MIFLLKSLAVYCAVDIGEEYELTKHSQVRKTDLDEEPPAHLHEILKIFVP